MLIIETSDGLKEIYKSEGIPEPELKRETTLCDYCKEEIMEEPFYYKDKNFCCRGCVDNFINKTPNIVCFCCNKKILKDDVYLTIDNHFFCDGSCIVNFINSAKERIKEMEMEEIKIDVDNRQLKARNEWLEKRHQELMAERKLIRRMLK